MLFCKIQDSLGYKNRMISSGERWGGRLFSKGILYISVLLYVSCGVVYFIGMLGV